MIPFWIKIEQLQIKTSFCKIQWKMDCWWPIFFRNGSLPTCVRENGILAVLILWIQVSIFFLDGPGCVLNQASCAGWWIANSSSWHNTIQVWRSCQEISLHYRACFHYQIFFNDLLYILEFLLRSTPWYLLITGSSLDIYILHLHKLQYYILKNK